MIMSDPPRASFMIDLSLTDENPTERVPPARAGHDVNVGQMQP
jgi:hypothetical protein